MRNEENIGIMKNYCDHEKSLLFVTVTQHLLLSNCTYK